MAMRVLVVMEREANLPKMAFALVPSSRFARRLHCGQQQRDQDADDRDHDQQLNQRETMTARHDDSYSQRKNSFIP
jgi:hypothetical protein